MRGRARTLLISACTSNDDSPDRNRVTSLRFRGQALSGCEPLEYEPPGQEPLPDNPDAPPSPHRCTLMPLLPSGRWPTGCAPPEGPSSSARAPAGGSSMQQQRNDGTSVMGPCVMIDGHVAMCDVPSVVGPYVAVLKHVSSSCFPYLAGFCPCSLDALLVGHLIYYRLSPAAPPVLQQKVGGGGGRGRGHRSVELVPLFYGVSPTGYPAREEAGPSLSEGR